MSNRAHARPARPFTPPRPGEDVGYSVLAGWCAGEGDLEEAKRATHDALLELMGDRRRGGVQWRICPAGEKADAAMAMLWEGGVAPELSDHYRRLEGHLREYGGILVVAMAKGIE